MWLQDCKTTFASTHINILPHETFPVHSKYYQEDIYVRNFILGIPAPIVGISIGIFSHEEYETDEA